MVAPLNFQLPSPTDLMTPMKAFNQGLSTVQNLYQTRATPQLLQSEIQKNRLFGLPPLDQAVMAYQNAAGSLGESHPTTQALKQNYQTMLGREQMLMNYQNVLAGAKDFSTLPTDWKNSVLAAGGRAPSIGQATGLGGVQIGGTQPGTQPSVISTNYASNPQATVQSQNLPQSQQQINKLQNTFGQTPPVINPQQANRLQTTGIAQPTAQDIYQQQYSPTAKVGLETQKEQAKTNIDAMNKLFQGDANSPGYNKLYSSADKSMQDIEEFHNSYQKASAKGPLVFANFIKNLDPDTQAAIKNSANLVASSVGVFKGMGRLNQNEFNTLKEGNLSVMLDPRAEDRLYNQFKASFSAIKAQSQLAQKLRSYTKDPNTLQYIVDNAGDTYSVVDEKGNIHMENVPKMLKYGTKEAVDAISSGQDYFPEDGSETGETLKDLKNYSLQTGIPLGQLITRVKKGKEREGKL